MTYFKKKQNSFLDLKEPGFGSSFIINNLHNPKASQVSPLGLSLLTYSKWEGWTRFVLPHLFDHEGYFNISKPFSD